MRGVFDDFERRYNTGMWERMLFPWLVIQLLLGAVLVAVPIVVTGTISLAITVPIYLIVLALAVVRETLQNERRQRPNRVRILDSLVSDLWELARGAGGARHWAILQDLRANGQFRAQMERSGNQQAGKLLDERCQRLFSDVANLSRRVRRMGGATAGEEVKDAITSFGRLLVEYRAVVQEFLQFLVDAKGVKETIQHKVPFSTRIHRDFADVYDRMMDSTRQAREELRLYAGHDWLPDDHLTRFPRAALLA